MTGRGGLRLAPTGREEEILARIPALRELRPRLGGDDAVLAQIRRQERQGYRLLAPWHEGVAVACGRYRLTENLIRGRHLYVDDLVTCAGAPSHDHGEGPLAALFAEVRAHHCRWVVLDSGVTNTGAHRVYLRQCIEIGAFHFAAPVEPGSGLGVELGRAF